MTERDPDDIEIMPRGSTAGDDARRVHGRSWVGRNRETLLRIRRIVASATMFAPPPARIPLAFGCVAIEGVLLAEDTRRGLVAHHHLALRTAGLVLEGGTLAASAAWAPKALARNGARLAMARRLIDRIERRGEPRW